MMKRMALLAVLLCASQSASAGEAFLSGIADLPLMPGLVEDVDAAMVFESPEGRIAQFKASGSPLADQVKRFYAESLPELGWTAQGKDRFRREAEELRLIVKPNGKKGSDVRFELAPAAAR